MPVYGTWNENQLFVEGTTKPRGGHRYLEKNKRRTPIFTAYCHGIPRCGKNTMLLFKTIKQRYTVDFSPVYVTVNENQP